MRRKDRQITEFNEIIEIIKKCDVCRIALNDKEFPYIVPLNFGLDIQGDQVFLYFHAAMKGKKFLSDIFGNYAVLISGLLILILGIYELFI